MPFLDVPFSEQYKKGKTQQMSVFLQGHFQMRTPLSDLDSVCMCMFRVSFPHCICQDDCSAAFVKIHLEIPFQCPFIDMRFQMFLLISLHFDIGHQNKLV